MELKFFIKKLLMLTPHYFNINLKNEISGDNREKSDKHYLHMFDNIRLENQNFAILDRYQLRRGKFNFLNA